MKPTNSVYVGAPPLDEPDYPACPICESEFRSKHELDLHLIRAHNIKTEED